MQKNISNKAAIHKRKMQDFRSAEHGLSSQYALSLEFINIKIQCCSAFGTSYNIALNIVI